MKKTLYNTLEYKQLSLSFQNGHVLSHRGHMSVSCPNFPQISELNLIKINHIFK